MKIEKEIAIISGFVGFTIGVCSMMAINIDKEQKIIEETNNCHEIIEEIEFEVCEECWYDVFDCGDRYEEVEYYTTWE